MESDARAERPNGFKYTMKTEPGARWATLLNTLEGEEGVMITEKDGKTFLSVRFDVREPAAFRETQTLRDGDLEGEHPRPASVFGRQ